MAGSKVLSDEDAVKRFLAEKGVTVIPAARATGLPDPDKELRKSQAEGHKYNNRLWHLRHFGHL